MLTNKELGAAIKEALIQNGKTQADAARLFGITAPSVSGWIRTGRIGKDKLDTLRAWLVKTPPEHWGSAFPALAQKPDEISAIASKKPLGDLTAGEVTELLLLYSNLNTIGRETIMQSLRLAVDAFSATPTNHKRKRR